MAGVDGWKLSDEEFRAVSALPARARYEHLVKRVADSEWIWMAPGAEGSFAVWPHNRHAEAYGGPEEARAEQLAVGSTPATGGERCPRRRLPDLGRRGPVDRSARDEG